MSRRGDSRNVWLAVALGLGMVASAEWAFAGPPPIRNPAGMRNPAGPSPRNPAGPPPLDPNGSFSHLRPISPPGGDSIVERGRPHGGGGNSHHGHHGSWQAGYGGYPSWGGGVTVFGSPFNDAGAFPYGANFYCQVHGIGFAFQDLFLQHIAYVDGVAPDWAATIMYNAAGVWVFPGVY